MRHIAIALILLGALGGCSGGGDDGGSPDAISLAPEDVATFYAADPGDQAAAIVSGDFNADGAADAALGAATADGEDNAAPDTGEVYIFNGPFSPGDKRDGGANEADTVFYGDAPGDNFGRTLAVGDFNGDDATDLVIAAPRANDKAGAFLVLFGGPGGLTATAPAAIGGGGAGDYTGLAMTAADLDGDGRDDLLIGALEADGPDNTRQDGGLAYVIGGSELAPGADIALGESTDVIYGAESGDRLGETLAAGDVNGDGAADLIVVATFASGPDNARESVGETYVFFSPLDLPIDMATEIPDITIIGRDAGDQLGHALAVGDRDGDGAADLALGAVSADGPENTVDLAGEVIFVDGTARGVIDTRDDFHVVYGPETEGRLGRYARAGAFLNGSLADVLVSAPNLAARAGIVYLLPARDDLTDTAGGGTTLAGLDPGDVLGTEVFGTPPMTAADIDSAGAQELLISAPQADGPGNTRTDAGEAYIVFFD